MSRKLPLIALSAMLPLLAASPAFAQKLGQSEFIKTDDTSYVPQQSLQEFLRGNVSEQQSFNPGTAGGGMSNNDGGMQNNTMAMGGAGVPMNNGMIMNGGMQNNAMMMGGAGMPMNNGMMSGGMQSNGMMSGGMQSNGMMNGGMQNNGMMNGGAGMPLNNGMMNGGMQSNGMMNGGMQAGSMMNGGMQNNMMGNAGGGDTIGNALAAAAAVGLGAQAAMNSVGDAMRGLGFGGGFRGLASGGQAYELSPFGGTGIGGQGPGTLFGASGGGDGNYYGGGSSSGGSGIIGTVGKSVGRAINNNVDYAARGLTNKLLWGGRGGGYGAGRVVHFYK